MGAANLSNNTPILEIDSKISFAIEYDFVFFLLQNYLGVSSVYNPSLKG